MTRTLEILDEALEEAEEAARWYAERSETAAKGDGSALPVADAALAAGPAPQGSENDLDEDVQDIPHQGRVVGQAVTQCDREGEHPLSDRHPREHAIDEVRGGVGHPAAAAGAAEPSAFAGECHNPVLTTGIAVNAQETVGQDHAVETGEKLWWVRGMSWQPKSAPVAAGDMIFVHSWEYGGEAEQPTETPTFEEALASYDRNGDRKISPEEITNVRLRNGFVNLDLDFDGKLDEREWNFHRARRAARNALLAVRHGGRDEAISPGPTWSGACRSFFLTSRRRSTTTTCCTSSKTAAS